MESFLDYNFFIYEPLKAYSLGIFSEKEAIQRFKRQVYSRTRHLFTILEFLRIEFDSIQAYNRSDEVSQLILLFEQLKSLHSDSPERKKEEKKQLTDEASNGQKRIKRRRVGKGPDLVFG